MKIIPAFLLCIALLTTHPGYSYTIRGFVVSSSSGEPLPVAAVQVAGTANGTSTNLDGYFVLTVDTVGSYTLHISYLGFVPADKVINLRDRTMEPVKIELKPKALQLESAEVRIDPDEAASRLSPEVSTVPVDAKTIRMIPSLGAEMDVLRALQNIPGVKAASDVSSALYIRGGSSDQTLIQMDYSTVYNPNHLFGLFSTFNADAVKRINLIKGGFPAEYGGRSGSVLEVITNDGNRKTVEGLVSIGVISARASLQGPLPKETGSYQVAFRRTYMEPLISLLRTTQNMDLPDYYFYDGNAKVNVDISPKSTLTIGGYWGNDYMDFDFGAVDSRLKLLMSWGNSTFSSRYRYALGENMYLSLGGNFSQYRSQMGIKNETVTLERQTDRFDDYTGHADLELLGSRSHKVKMGISASNWRIVFNERNQDITMVDIDKATNTYAMYLEDSWRINDFFEIQPGIRGYYHQRGDKRELDPRLAMVYYYDSNMRFKGTVGRYTQLINMISFGETASNFDVWVPVDESMSPGYSYQGILGWEWERPNGYEFTTEAYYTDMHDLAEFDASATSANVASDAFVQGYGNAYGWEVMLKKNQGTLTGWLGYSLSWTRRRFPGTLVNDGNWYYPKWDRRHDFIAVANYSYSSKWVFSGTWRFNTGQGFTQADGLFTERLAYLDPSYTGDLERTIRNGAKNNYRFPSDHRLDLSATYSHTFFHLPAKLVLSVFNVYSRRAYYQRNFNVDVNPMEITDLKLLPIIPLVGYEVKF